MIKEIAIFTLLLGILLVGMTDVHDINIQHAYAHSFTPNSLSTFLTLVYRAQVELSLATNNFPLNVTLALDQSENAASLINDVYRMDDDIVDDADFAGKYNEALNTRNSTIHALAVANTVDQVLKEYGEAFDVGYDLTNMSNMNMTLQPISNSDPLSSSSPSYSMNSNIEAEENYNYTNVVNIDNYQSAQKLLEKVSQIFKSKLLSLASSNSTDPSVMIRLEKSMADLNHLVESKAPAQELMMVVHGQVHPSLQAAYNLKLKQ